MYYRVISDCDQVTTGFSSFLGCRIRKFISKRSLWKYFIKDLPLQKIENIFRLHSFYISTSANFMHFFRGGGGRRVQKVASLNLRAILRGFSNPNWLLCDTLFDVCSQSYEIRTLSLTFQALLGESLPTYIKTF